MIDLNNLGHTELERQKIKARSVLISPTASMTKKMCAALRLIDVDYWRARKQVEGMPKKDQRRIHGKRYCAGYTLDIDVYTRHWLHANSDIVPPDVLEAVCAQWSYKPEESPYLFKGSTVYS